jgi:hypothetical protein
MIAQNIRNAPADSDSIDIETKHLQALKTCCFQLSQASRSLEMMGREKENYVEQFVVDKHGNPIPVPFTQIYNQPDADYEMMGIRYTPNPDIFR